jgi:hypothetical protein
MLHTQEVRGSSPCAPTIPAFQNQWFAISVAFHCCPPPPKTYQNRIKTPSVLNSRIKTLASPFLVGTAIQLGQGFPFHLQLHLRILLEHFGIGLPQHLRHPLVSYAARAQPRCIS